MSKSGIGVAGNVVFGVYNGSKWSAYIDGVGKLYASGANIEGTIKSSDADIEGKIVANSGTIGGCKITNNTLTIKNANIESINGVKIESGTIYGNRLVGNTVTTAYTSSGINTSLGYADFANDVFNNIEQAPYINVNHLYGTNLQATHITAHTDLSAPDKFYLHGYSISRSSARVTLADGTIKTIFYLDWN